MKIVEWYRRRKQIKYLKTLTTDKSIEKITILIAGVEYQVAQEILREAKARATAAEADQLRSMNASRPSRNFGISLTNDGLEWVARFPAGVDPRNDLIGRGETPEAAMLNFDQQWYGSIK